MRHHLAAAMLAALAVPAGHGSLASAQPISDFRLQPGESATATPRPQGPVDPDTPAPPRPVIPAPSTPAPSARPASAGSTTPASAATADSPAPPASRAPAPSDPAARQTHSPAPSAPARSTFGASPVRPSAPPVAASPASPSILPPVTTTLASPPAASVAPPSTGEGDGIAWYFWLIPALVLGALAAWFFLGRRERPATAPPAIRPAAVPPDAQAQDLDRQTRPAAQAMAATPAPALAEIDAQPVRLHLALDALRMNVSLINATLHYRMRIANTSPVDLGPISLGVDMIGAHASLPQESQLAQDGTALAEIHRLPALAPGEHVDVAGELRLPLAQILPIHAGTASLFVPLVRIQARATGLAISRVLVVGENPAQPEGLLRPFRLDQGPRIFGAIAHRELAAA